MSSYRGVYNPKKGVQNHPKRVFRPKLEAQGKKGKVKKGSKKCSRPGGGAGELKILVGIPILIPTGWPKHPPFSCMKMGGGRPSSMKAVIDGFGIIF